jgi:hypothetical protein
VTIIRASCAQRKGELTSADYDRLSDQALVDAAVPLLPPNNYRAAEMLGVAEGTVRNLRKGGTGELRAGTRKALLRFVEGHRGGLEAGEGVDDEWVETALRTARLRNGEESDDPEWRRIQRDLVSGYIRLGRREGRDPAAIARLEEVYRNLGHPQDERREPRNLAAADAGAAVGAHHLFELLRIDAIAADKRADAAKDLAAAARIEAEEMQARRLTLSEAELLADEAQVWAAVDELDRQAGTTHPAPSPAAPPGRPRPAPERRERR